MAYWAVFIPADRWATERLFHHDTLTVPVGVPAERSEADAPAGAGDPGGLPAGAGADTAAGAGDPRGLPAGSGAGAAAAAGDRRGLPAGGDEVLVVAGGDSAAVVAAGVVKDVHGGAGGPSVLVAYTRRAFDEPVAADGLAVDPAATASAAIPVGGDVFERLAGRLGGERRGRRNWLVSVHLPIEASSPADAVRQFWSYVSELGPAQLPAYVSPSGDELAMQAYVLGVVANQDPEEDEDD
jgi:hypothetical protein